ncbi:N-methyl-L-tryptophan oxidase [Paenibacillus sp. L3-i20]|uniref:N-methyl-L-tryptophan oxidase n=1 Tax=Paenibacillus sp. L3-i20 TaxID=2905833 RepID=UPI001EE0B850|nr:N-methyl-L-tryptophan oxidase [Paenibacillus sp. L3-i20]GKU79109.1 N-methyl-L-tryptophan oxidase [Paenibacillus sp. L3-i20]
MNYDIIIAGAGSMGMSAGYYLAKQGVKTLLIDAFDPPHSSGSHHGDTRLMRHVYAGNHTYTKMAIRADQLWRDLEEVSGTPLLIRSGVLNMGATGSQVLKEKLDHANSHHIRVEILNANEIQRRWNGIHVPDHYAGLYEPEAGFLFSEKVVQTYRDQALLHGASLLTNTTITNIESDNNHVTVTTNQGSFRAAKLIMSMGAWFDTASHFIKLPIRPLRKAVAWFEAEESLFDYKQFPGFTIGDGEKGFYGFPSFNGSGVKIGRHDAGQLWSPDHRFEPYGHYPADELDLRAALESFFPRAAGKVLKGAVCKYEMTPDEDFIIDRHPLHSNIVIAGGFSGHGFKFASVVGEILTDLIIKGKSEHDTTPFAISRFADSY